MPILRPTLDIKSLPRLLLTHRMWGRKPGEPAYTGKLRDGKPIFFGKLAEARIFASANGYSGIWVGYA